MVASGDTYLKAFQDAGFVTRPAGGSNGQALGLVAGDYGWLDITGGGGLETPDQATVGTITTSAGPGTITVPWAYAVTGALADGVTIVLSNGDKAENVTVSPYIFTGEPAVSTTAQVFPSNAAGDGPLSTVSNAVTPTVPSATTAPIILQSTAGTAGTTATGALVFGSNPTASTSSLPDALIALVSWASNPSSGGGALSAPAGWAQLGSSVAISQDTSLALFYKMSAGSSDKTTNFAATNAPAYLNVAGWEISGATEAAILNAVIQFAPTSGITLTTASVVPLVLKSIALIAGTIDGNSTMDATTPITSGWTVDQFENGASGGYHPLVIGHGDTATSDTTTAIGASLKFTTPTSGFTTGDVVIILLGPVAPTAVTPSVPTIPSTPVSAGATSVNVTVAPGTTGIPSTTYVQAYAAGVAVGTPTQVPSNGQKPLVVKVSGLTTGTAYTFAAAEGNSAGRSSYSSQSGSVTPTAAVSGSAVWGVHLSAAIQAPSDESRAPGYAAWLGQAVPISVTFGVRDTYAKLIAPNYAITPVTAQGRTTAISYDVFISGSSDPKESWAQASIGSNVTSTGETYAARAAAFFANLVAQGQGNCPVRVNQEFNTASGTSTSSAGVPAIYGHTGSNGISDTTNWINAWRVIKAARDAVAPDIKLDWNPSIDPGDSHDPCADAWPGDAYVDIVGIDSYDGDSQYGTAWTTEQDEWNKRLNGVSGGKGIQHYADFAAGRTTPLPISFPEWGLGWYYYATNDPDRPPYDTPYYVQAMFAFINANNVAYAAFWEDFDRGIYQPGAPCPNANAMFRATFGSQESAVWV
jgi:hypothetical protein